MDYESLATILSFFVISRGLELSGFFGRMASVLVKSSSTEFGLLGITALIVSFSSAVIMNDTAIFVFVPLVLAISRVAEIDLSKSVTFVAIAANVGSALTPFGNPQNIILWRTYRFTVWEFVRSMFPYVLFWILFLLIFIWICGKKRSLKISAIPKIRIRRGLMLISLSLLAINIILAEENLPYIGLALTIFVIAIFAREALFSVDVAIIAIFALIFIDFKELSLFLPSLTLPAIKTVIFSACLTQIVSNVPATVMLASTNHPWLPLAIGVNLGGSGLITGSLANFIAIRLSGIRLKDFHRYSISYFLVTLMVTITAMVISQILKL